MQTPLNIGQTSLQSIQKKSVPLLLSKAVSVSVQDIQSQKVPQFDAVFQEASQRIGTRFNINQNNSLLTAQRRDIFTPTSQVNIIDALFSNKATQESEPLTQFDVLFFKIRQIQARLNANVETRSLSSLSENNSISKMNSPHIFGNITMLRYLTMPTLAENSQPTFLSPIPTKDLRSSSIPATQNQATTIIQNNQSTPSVNTEKVEQLPVAKQPEIPKTENQEPPRRLFQLLQPTVEVQKIVDARG